MSATATINVTLFLLLHHHDHTNFDASSFAMAPTRFPQDNPWKRFSDEKTANYSISHMQQPELLLV